MQMSNKRPQSLLSACCQYHIHTPSVAVSLKAPALLSELNPDMSAGSHRMFTRNVCYDMKMQCARWQVLPPSIPFWPFAYAGCPRHSIWSASTETRSNKAPTLAHPHSQQHSVPDSCQITLRADLKGLPRVTADPRKLASSIVEIKYAPDPDIQCAIQQTAIDQHDALKQSLETYEWGLVSMYPVIFGNAGTVTATHAQP